MPYSDISIDEFKSRMVCNSKQPTGERRSPTEHAEVQQQSTGVRGIPKRTRSRRNASLPDVRILEERSGNGAVQGEIDDPRMASGESEGNSGAEPEVLHEGRRTLRRTMGVRDITATRKEERHPSSTGRPGQGPGRIEHDSVHKETRGSMDEVQQDVGNIRWESPFAYEAAADRDSLDWLTGYWQEQMVPGELPGSILDEQRQVVGWVHGPRDCSHGRLRCECLNGYGNPDIEAIVGLQPIDGGNQGIDGTYPGQTLYCHEQLPSGEMAPATGLRDGGQRSVQPEPVYCDPPTYNGQGELDWSRRARNHARIWQAIGNIWRHINAEEKKSRKRLGGDSLYSTRIKRGGR
jgi:hypothetical protein